MRILFLIHDFLPAHPAGSEVHAWQLAKALQARGHDCRVFATEKDVGRPHLALEQREYDGLIVHELVNNLFYEDFRETWDWPPGVAAFERVLDAWKPDVLHVMHLMYLSSGCIEAAVRRGLPVVFTLHDFWLQCARFGQRYRPGGIVCDTIDHEVCARCLVDFKFAQSPLQRRAATIVAGVRRVTRVNLAPLLTRAARVFASRATQTPPTKEADPERVAAMRARVAERERGLKERVVANVDRFLAPSRFLYDRFVEWGIDEARLSHVEYGFDKAPFHGFQRRPSERVRVAFLGTLAPHKGPELLLDAWGALAPELKAEAELTLYGPKSHNPDLVRRLEDKARTVGARLAGARSREELAATLAQIDLLVVPSLWYENSPFTIHEAQATRTPLLVSDLGGMRELVDERFGWRFRVGDVADLTAKLAHVLAEPEVLSRLTLDSGRVKDVAETAREMEDLYSSLSAAAARGESSSS